MLQVTKASLMDGNMICELSAPTELPPTTRKGRAGARKSDSKKQITDKTQVRPTAARAGAPARL